MDQENLSLKLYDCLMQRKTITRVLSATAAVILISAFSGTGAQAATKATAGGLCVKAGSKTTIATKSYTCAKVLSGKLVWVPTAAATTKPKISGGVGGDGGPGDDNNGMHKVKRTSKTGETTAPSQEVEGADN